MTSYSRYFTPDDFEKFFIERKMLQNSTPHENDIIVCTEQEDVNKNTSTSEKLNCVEMESITLTEQDASLGQKNDYPLNNSTPQSLSFSSSNTSYNFEKKFSEDIHHNLKKWCRCFIEQKPAFHEDDTAVTSSSLAVDEREESVFKSEIKCERCQLEIHEKQRRKQHIIKLWMNFFGSSSSTESCDSYCSNMQKEISGK